MVRSAKIAQGSSGGHPGSCQSVSRWLASGCGKSVTVVPMGNSAVQVPGHSKPGGSEITVPGPVTVRESETIWVMGGSSSMTPASGSRESPGRDEKPTRPQAMVAPRSPRMSSARTRGSECNQRATHNCLKRVVPASANVASRATGATKAFSNCTDLQLTTCRGSS
jgi:hypothetical protein